MRRDPLAICREYLRSSSPETRRKAVAALAVNDGAEELARLALEDQDAGVRRRAEQAIARLAPEARSIALAEIDEALARNDIAAHAFLTRLRNQGIPLPRSRRSLLERLRLAFAVRRAATEHDSTAWKRSYPWCLTFALLGALLVSFLVALKTNTATFGLPVAIVVIVLLLTPLLAHAASSGARPGDRYLDRLAGWTVEILSSGLAALPVLAGSIVLLLLLWPPLVTTSSRTLILLGAGLLAWGWFFVAVIRATTLSTAILFRRSWGSTFLGAGAGWGAGILAANILLYTTTRSATEAAEEIVALTAVFRLFALPTAAGVAATFARLERSSVPPRRWRFRVLALPGVLSFLLLINYWILFFGQHAALPAPCQAHLIETPESCDQTFERLPAMLRIRVGFTQKVRILKPQQGATDLVLRLWQDDRQIFAEAERPLIETELEVGDYQLEITDYSSLNAAAHPLRRDFVDQLFIVAKRLAGLTQDDAYALWARDVRPFELELTLNSDPPAAVRAGILSHLLEDEIEQAFALYDRHPALHASVKLLDQLCRTTSVQGLLKLQRSRSGAIARIPRAFKAVTRDHLELDRLATVCDRAVAASGGNGAARDSRGLANLLFGAPSRAVEDFAVFERWTVDPWEKEQRRQWIAALSDPARDPRDALPLDHLTTLLSKSRSRDLESWTRASAQAHVARGANALQQELCRPRQEPSMVASTSPEPAPISEPVSVAEPAATAEPATIPEQKLVAEAPLPAAFEQARSAFEQAVLMVPALADDPGFWRYPCYHGALLEPSRAAAVIAVCANLSGAPSWIDELKEASTATLRELQLLRQKACDNRSVPTVPAVVFDGPKQSPSEGSTP